MLTTIQTVDHHPAAGVFALQSGLLCAYVTFFLVLLVRLARYARRRALEHAEHQRIKAVARDLHLNLSPGSSAPPGPAALPPTDERLRQDGSHIAPL